MTRPRPTADGRRIRRKRGPRRILATALAALAAALATGPAAAQVPPAGEPGDVLFRTVDGTTGQPCVVQRLLLQENTMTMDEVADVEPTADVFRLRDVPLVDARAYIATAWFRDVPYYWEFRGRFLDQDTNTVHVFDVTDDLAGVEVSGLDLIFRRSDQLVEYEAVLVIANENRPQRTVRGRSVELTLPAGATSVEAVLHRGPTPEPLRTTLLGPTRLALEVPLTPGNTRIRIRCTAEWKSGFEIPIECNLPIQAWSLIGSPDYLEFVSFEMEPRTEDRLPGVKSFTGPALPAGRAISIRVDDGKGPAPEAEVFTAPAPGESTNAAEPAPRRGGRVPLPLLVLAVALIAGIVVVRRRSRG